METRVENSNNVTIITVQGKLDGATSTAFQQEIFGIIEGGSHRIVIDAAHLSYVASAGLRVLLASGKKVKALQGRIVLCNVNEMIREVLEISGFAPLFPTFPTREDAIKAF